MEQNQEMQYRYETVINIVADMVTQYMKSAECSEIITVDYTILGCLAGDSYFEFEKCHEIIVAA
jgi:hypothetical protein